MATVGIGSNIKLTVRFYDYQSGPLVDPEVGPSLDIQHNNTSVLTAPITYPDSIVREAIGVYSYTYAVPTSATVGDYKAIWTATQEGNEVHGLEIFTVAGGGTTTGTGTALGSDYEINYIATMDPVFLDPDEILAIFPDAEAPMVLESIYRVSSQILAWMPKATVDNLTPQAYDYLIAAVACDLSQRYGLTASDEYSITLGDLSVTYDQENGSVSGGSSSTVDWCALAAQLQTEIRYGLTPMKGVVRGARLPNPIPRRSIDKKHARIHLQGTLDDAQGPTPRL